MSCKYYFNNKTFENEIELDEEILRLMSVTDNIHDLVFSKKMSEVAEHNSKVLIEADKAAGELQFVNKTKESITYKEVDTWTEDGMYGLDTIVIPPEYSDYISVTQLIKSARVPGSDGKSHKLSPVFEIENYWDVMKKKLATLADKSTWQDPATNKIYITQELVDALFGQENATPENITPDQFPKYRLRLENYWKSQAVIGELVHSLLEYGIQRALSENKVDRRTLIKDLAKQKSIEETKKSNNNQDIWSSKADFLGSVADAVIDITDNIKKEYTNPKAYCEIKVVGNLTGEFKAKKVFGKFDLVIIDDNGKVGIYDFKCSPKDYKDYNSAKKRTFEYQLAIYRRMIKQLDIISNGQVSINIIPIKFLNFAYHDDLDNEPVPISEARLKELRKSGHTTLTGISLRGVTSKDITSDLDKEINSNILQVEENLNLIIEEPLLVQDDNAIQQHVNEFISKIAPEWFDFRDINNEAKLDEKVGIFIKNQGGIQKSENGDNEYYFNYTRYNKILTGKSEAEIIKQIKEFWKKSRGRAQKRAEKITDILLDAKRHHGSFTYSSYGKLADPDRGTYDYVEKMLSKYADSEWEVITKSSRGISKEVAAILQAHGIMLFRNKYSHVIDVVKCASNSTDVPVLLGPKNNRRKYIMGTFMTDDNQISDSTTPPLESVEGNLELIETLAVLNYIPKTIQNLGNVIGEVKVINTDGSDGIGGLDAPSDQLIRNFRKLFTLAGLNNCQIGLSNSKANVKFSTYTELVARILQSIKARAEDSNNTIKINDEVLGFYDAINESLLNNANSEKMLLQMQGLQQKLEEKYPTLKGKPITERDSAHPERDVYNEVLLSIAELQNVQLVQQLQENPNYFNDLSLKSLFLHGVHGLNVDNPGMLTSQNLNNLTYLTERAYQNVRATTQAFNEKLRVLIKKLKQDQNQTSLSKYTIGNQANMYQKFYDKNAKKCNKLQLVKLESPNLTPIEREFLTFAVKKFAYDRGVIEDISLLNPDGTFNEGAFEQAYENYPDKVLQIPLARASFGSTVASSGGLLKALQTTLRQWLPSNIKEYIQGKYYELLDTSVDSEGSNQKKRALAGEIFEMINRVKNSYQDDLREKLLNNFNSETKSYESKVDLYETNLEKLLLYSQFSLAMEKELNRIFPSLKAIVLSLSMQGVVQNDKFAKDVDYAINYIKNKILGLPLEDMDKFGATSLVISELMQITSKLALAFNPLQLYQIIDGIWKDILLIMQKPDVDLPEDSAFTKAHMSDAFMWILQDIVHVGDDISMGEAFNNLYGLNDRDINVFTDRINSDTAGIFNFWSLGFRFASRPDYYNRMTIFGAQMRKDGSFKAHSMVDGKLVYDWTKDERFSIYADPSKKSHPEYQKQKALYLAMANEFILEGARDANGKLFTLGTDDKPTALPRAYTTKQSESMKAIADKIYGYYTHEKKSMMQSYTLGALILQMHTYWSAKKNQYLAGHSFSQEGQFVQFKQLQADGTYQEYWCDEQGLPTTTNTGVPYMVWEGRPYEGIIVTLGNILRDMLVGERDESGNVITEDGKELKGWSYMMSKNFSETADLRLRRLHRANMVRLAYDLLGALFIGQMLSPALMNAVKKYIKDHENKTLSQALINTTLFGTAKMFKSSADDFFILNSLFGLVVDWDPFSISAAKRVAQLSVNIFDTDKDAIDALIKYSAATRNTEHIWDYAKYSITGRFIGETAEE